MKLHPVELIHISLIFISLFIAYHRSLDAGLVFDDEVAIVQNSDIRPTSSLYNLFKNDYWGTPLISHLSHKSYRPLTVLTFRLNYMYHKLNPFGYHLVNILLHSIASALVYRLSTRIIRSSTYCLLAGLLFALHPVHSDAVISVVGRGELLSSIFYLLGLLLITDPGLIVNCNDKFKRRLVGSIILSCLGLLCKEQCLMLLPLLISFIWVDSATISYRDCEQEMISLKKSSTLLKCCFCLVSYFKILDSLISSFFSLSFLQTNLRSQHKSHQFNNNNKKLRKQTKTIWLLGISFVIVLLIRLSLHGRTVTVNFSTLDQIQSINSDGASVQATFRMYDNKTESSREIEKSNLSLSAFLTYVYVITFNFWLLFYPDQLACDWSYGSLTPVLQYKDIRNLFSISLIVLYVVPFSNFILRSQIRFKELYLKLFLLIIIPFAPVLCLQTGFVLAERVLYLPSIGYCILIAFIFENYFGFSLQGKLTKDSLKIASILTICLTLYAMTIKCQIRSLDCIHKGYLRAYSLLAELYIERNHTEKALSILFKAREQVMLKLDSGKLIAQESMRILIRLEQLLQLHRPVYGQNVQKDIIELYRKLYWFLSGTGSYLNSNEIYNLALILKSNDLIQDSIDLLRQNIESGSHSIHTPSLELYNELLKPQQAISHFRAAMQLSNKQTTTETTTLHRIRFHLEQCIFHDPTFVQAHYNLALTYYKLNLLHQARHHLNKVVNLEANHLKANLMLCDLLLEDENLSNKNFLFDAVHCYTKLLNGSEEESTGKPRNLHESKDKINSSDFERPHSSRNYDNKNESNQRSLNLARHNLCSVLDLINRHSTDNNYTPINTDHISILCLTSTIPTNSFIQQIHFQIPITAT